MFTIGDIAKKLDGRVIGDGNKIVSSISAPEDIKEGSIVFIKDKKNFARVIKKVVTNLKFTKLQDSPPSTKKREKRTLKVFLV